MIGEAEIAKIVEQGTMIRREDVARAKEFILKEPVGSTDELVDRWLKAQQVDTTEMVDYYASECEDLARRIGRMYSVRLAFYQAVWELVTSGDIVPLGQPQEWGPRLGYKTSHGSGGIPVPELKYPYLTRYHRPRQDTASTDPDIFLQGIVSKTLHEGIREGIDQALGCFRRGLYMPATVMLAAATEATWTECSKAVAKKLGNSKLDKLVNDPMSSIAKIVVETRKSRLNMGDAKDLLMAAGQHISKVTEAEVWTNALRDRRNALHWGKAKSFIADHSETGTLLMAAPQHLGTLEAIRVAC